jgi:hypothetical protein
MISRQLVHLKLLLALTAHIRGLSLTAQNKSGLSACQPAAAVAPAAVGLQVLPASVAAAVRQVTSMSLIFFRLILPRQFLLCLWPQAALVVRL